MSAITVARGLSCDWLNGWLAAIGVTALLPEVQLAWTDDAIPCARFRGVEDLAAAIRSALPTGQGLADSSIARDRPGHAPLGRNFDLVVWTDRAMAERDGTTWHLAASATDLVELAEGDPLPHSPFDPPMPKGITLHDRAVSCHDAVQSAEQVQASLDGIGQVVQQNGLGFDARRLPTAVESSGQVYVDPVVESLAFAALPLFPTRGSGSGKQARTRGWTGRATQAGAFRWPAWDPWLDRWGVDAFLDRFYRGDDRGVTAVHESVPYRPTGSSDTTRAYASARIRRDGRGRWTKASSR